MGSWWQRPVSRETGISGSGSATMRKRRFPVRMLVALCTTAALVSGCGIAEFRGVHSLPLPGGADLGEHPYQVKVHFRDVLDLVPNAGVRVNDVPVGRVDSVELAPNSWLAEVTLSVNGHVDLPANAVANIRQSSLLGEKYVQLAPPPKPTEPVGALRDGTLIGVERTGRNPEVEEVLGALSLLLNGGGIAQIQNIAEELNKALQGREADVRGLLSNLDALVADLDAQRDDITRALDSVNRLSATLAQQRDDIDVALRDLGPGLKVLNDQRDQLVTMLKSLDELSGVATDVVNRTRQDLVHNLKSLRPVLHQLAAAGSDLPKSLEILLTYPFTDAAVRGIKGDYTNLYLDVNLNLTTLLGNVGRSRQPPAELPGPPLPLPLPLPGGGDPRPAPKEPAPKEPAPQEPPPDSGDSDGSGDSGGLLDSLFGGR